MVTALINDETDEASAIIKGQQAEELFGTTCEDLILNKNHDNPNILLPEVLRTEGQTKLLELEIGTAQNVIVKAIHEDIRGLTPTQRIQPSNSTPKSQMLFLELTVSLILDLMVAERTGRGQRVVIIECNNRGDCNCYNRVSVQLPSPFAEFFWETNLYNGEFFWDTNLC